MPHRARGDCHLCAARSRRAWCRGIEVLHLVDPPGILEELPPAPADESHPARIVADPASCLGFRAMTTAPAENDAIRCPASPRPAQAALCVPMQTAHGQIGVVHICARPGEPITNIPRGFAETLVRVFAPAMENARLLRESIERGRPTRSRGSPIAAASSSSGARRSRSPFANNRPSPWLCWMWTGSKPSMTSTATRRGPRPRIVGKGAPGDPARDRPRRADRRRRVRPPPPRLERVGGGAGGGADARAPRRTPRKGALISDPRERRRGRALAAGHGAE
mgnify:CR=1 FL=1